MQNKEPTGHKSDELAGTTTRTLDDRASAHMTRWDGVKITIFLVLTLLGAYIATNPEVFF